MHKIYKPKLQFSDINPIEFGHIKCTPAQSIEHKASDCVLICYVSRGCGVLYKNGDEYAVRENQAFVVQIAEDAVYKADSNTPWEIRFVAFNGALSEKYRFVPTVIDMNDGTFPDVDGSEDEFSEYTLVSQLFKLTAEVLYPRLVSNQYVLSTINYIEHHYMEKISVAELANNISLDRSYLSRIFKKEIGRTIQEYIKIFRMKKAHQLLCEGQNVMQTAMLCGYSDFDSFTKAFRSIYAITPAEFKKRLKKKE